MLAEIDPLDARAAERAQAAAEALRAITFGEAPTATSRLIGAGWKNEKHAAQWKRTSTYAKPIIGALAVQAVDTTAG